MKSLPHFRFVGFRWLWTTKYDGWDLSFGVHLCWKGRIDIHLGVWMYSFGRVPIFETKTGRRFAASNSFYEDQKSELRAGVPNHNPNV